MEPQKENPQTSTSREKQDLENLTANNGYTLAIQLTLRAILLKLNSETAHVHMRGQLLAQVDEVAEMMLKSEEKFASEYLPDAGNMGMNVIKSEIEKNMEEMRNKARAVVMGIFAEPEDVAGIQ